MDYKQYDIKHNNTFINTFLFKLVRKMIHLRIILAVLIFFVTAGFGEHFNG